MSDQFVAEIRMFGCNFAPTGWALCNGQLMPISQNTALFSLLGTFYGGDGKSTFALPDLQGRSGMNQGSGAGLSERFLGEEAGEDSLVLLTTEIPGHNHNLMSKPLGGQGDPSGKLYGSSGTQLPAPFFYSNALGSAVTMNGLALGIAGSSLPHNNLMPYQVVNFCIALQGIFPPRG
jgi:microcystin-dependent protein